ncbi:hypothetical protein O0880_25270 [Janthinobacterium sp. SUN118]|uniref:hypothetical protein n=1 Tax=Janthinobacterium sp. SUN118 TaxID=3004100 RepID=UPI0025B0F6A8|nr:hypothetical protein [Janthinobacterium sp. SUN118]MDN2712730.1 hypothetical protein [Janthinobacterium sp. SUN118]
MKKYMWHLYYSGTDVVDASEAWASGHVGAGICQDCGNYVPGNEGDFAVVVEQRIPAKADMFSMGRLSPSIMSARLRKLLPERINEFFRFGDVYLGDSSRKMESHCAFVGGAPWVLLFGDQPAMMDGAVVADAKIAACPACGVKFGFGRGSRHADTSVNVIHEISWTEFGGMLISDDIMQPLRDTQLKNVRVEKIEIR